MGIAIAVHGDVLQDIDISNMRAEMSGDPLARLDHALQKERPCRPTLAVYLPLTPLPDAQPMAIFLSDPPKPPLVWPSKCESTRRES